MSMYIDLQKKAMILLDKGELVTARSYHHTNVKTPTSYVRSFENR